MTEGHASRAMVLTRALTGALSNAEAAQQLGLSVRQVRRLKGVLLRGGRAPWFTVIAAAARPGGCRTSCGRG